MDAEQKKVFVRSSLLYAAMGNLNLSNEQLSNLYIESLEIARYLGDVRTELIACDELGALNFQRSRFSEAIKYFEACLNIAKQTGDKASEGNAYGDLGSCYRSLGQYDTAMYNHEMNLKIANDIGDIESKGRAYRGLGNCYNCVGQYNKALHHHEMHLNIAKQTGDMKGETQSHANVGNCFYLIGQYGKAIHHHKADLKIAKQIGDKVGEGRAYANLGNSYHRLSQYNEAILHHKMYLNITKQTGEKRGEGRAYGNLGSCYHSLGQYDEALFHHEMHLHIAKQIGDKAAEGGACGNLGKCYFSRGKYDKAIQHFKVKLNIAEQIGDKAGEGRAHGSLGSSYWSLGQYEMAIRHHLKHLSITKEIGAKAGEGSAYGSLGCCYRSLGQYDKAVQSHEMSLNIAKQIGDKEGEGTTYGALGSCYFSLEQYNMALLQHEMHLNIAIEIGDKAGEGLANENLGVCYDYLGQSDKAVTHQEMALSIAMQIGDKKSEGSAHRNLGACYLFLKQYDKAEDHSRKSLQCYDELFENVPKNDLFKTSVRDTFMTAYIVLTKALLSQDKTNEALVSAERGRARALAELMLTQYSNQSNEVMKAKILDIFEIRAIVKAIGSLVLFLALDTDGINMWVLHPNGKIQFKKEHIDSIESKKCELLLDPTAAVLEELQLLVNKVRKTHGFSHNAHCEDRSLSFLYGEKETRQETEEAGPFLTPEETEGSPVCSPFPPTGNPDEEDSELPSSRSVKTARQAERPTVTSSPRRDLYQLVLGPVRQFVQGSELVVVADQSLNLVPFSALVDESGLYVAETLKVRLVPSLATAKMVMEGPQEPGCKASSLIVGDPSSDFAPELPCAYDEAHMIGQLLGVQPLTRKLATKKNFLDKVECASLIHIAAHGDMKRGEILFATEPGGRKRKEDHMLMMRDLEKKSLKAKLVVLSCCHSARGEVRAEGVIGIARAFLGAGARAVLVALWGIDDKATLYFMKKFYQNLSRGEKASESLDKAMKAMRDTKDFADAWYWGPFVLVGENVSLS